MMNGEITLQHHQTQIRLGKVQDKKIQEQSPNHHHLRANIRYEFEQVPRIQKGSFIVANESSEDW